MSCIEDKCEAAAKFYCLDCLGLKIFCKNHSTDHMIAERHAAKVINEKDNSFIRSKQLKQKIKTFITNITAESNKIISAVKSITIQIIKQVKKNNSSIEKISDFSEIKFQDKAVQDVIERINCLNQNIVNIEAQNISKEFQELKLSDSELPGNVIYELLDEKLNRLYKVSNDIEAKIKKADKDLKFTKDLSHEIKARMMKITAKGLLYIEFNSFDFEAKKLQISSIIPSINLKGEKELIMSNDGQYLFYCN